MGSLSNDACDEYVVRDRVHSDPDSIRVICVGAGASGLCLAYKMKLHMSNYELICYEKNESAAGVWYENRYPGCACDIPAHCYTYTFEPNPSWSTFYAYAPEIKQYFLNFQDKYKLKPYIKFNSRVLSAAWNEEQGKYHVQVDTPEGPKLDWCHVLINGCGVLNDWKWPSIDGLHDFKGTLLHSAHWDEAAVYKGKRVAVIGTGSSGIQIVANIQPEVEHLVSFMRSPTWISPAVAQDVKAGFSQSENAEEIEKAKHPLASMQHHFTKEEISRFEQDPEYHLEFRRKMENAMNNATEVFIAGSEMNDGARKMMKAEMEKRLGPGNEELKERLIPKWAPGCRRLTPGDGYLEALVQPNVTRVFNEIDHVTPTGLVTDDGTLYEVDVLICATGFNVGFTPSFKLKGAGDSIIQDEWAKEPHCYLGLAAPHFPNYFTILGPRGPWGNGPLLPSIETLCDYFVEVMKKMQKEQIKALEVREEPTTSFNEHVDKWMAKSVWMTECRSWYKMGTVHGKAWLWPGGTLSYLKTIKEPRYEDYMIRYKNRNPWTFLGNGKIAAEVLNTAEKLSPYLRNSDTPWTI